MRTHLLLVSAALVALLALAAPTAHAQGTTTAAITGTVVDATGLGLPGATVVAVHEPSGTRYGAATRSDGGFDLRGLRIGGPYTVTASFLGYVDAVQADIELALGQSLTLNVTLAEDDAALGEVTVTAEAAGATISQDRTGASTNVGEESIEGLPTIARSLSDFARLSPLATVSNSGTSVGGRNNRFNNIQIDGATLNDVFGLAGSGTPGGQAGTQPVSLDAVEQFNVEVAPFDVRYGNFTGGLINVVTRSGTNRFSGSARFLTRDESFVGDRERNRVLIPQSPFTDNIYIATLGGPILQNRLFFFLSGEYAESNFPNETGLIGSSAANIFPASTETIGQVISTAQETYDFNPGGFDLLTNSRDSGKLLAKLDWNISPQHRFSLRNNYVRAGDDQGNTRSQSTFDLGNRFYVFRSTQNSTAAQLNSTFGGRASNEARLVYTAIRDNREVPEGSEFPETLIRLTPTEVVRLGVERSSQANALDQDLFEFTDNLSYFTGDHTLTLGTSNQLFRFRNLFIQDYYGSYEFNGGFTADVDGDGDTETATGLDAFRLGQPSRYRFSYASELQVDDQGRVTFGADGAPIRTVNTGATPEATFVGGQVGLYAQDEWNVRDDLRLTLGLRADLPFFPDTPTLNPLVSGGTGVDASGAEFEILPAFREEAYVRAYARGNGLDEDATVAAYNGAGTYNGPRFEDYSELSTEEVPNGNLLVSPRLGFNYRTPALAGRTLQVRGGTGIFSGRTPNVW
ncbi:MAG TPA: TonB-dependent receptor, partial [Rubricoccaceae bacterium]